MTGMVVSMLIGSLAISLGLRYLTRGLRRSPDLVPSDALVLTYPREVVLLSLLLLALGVGFEVFLLASLTLRTAAELASVLSLLVVFVVLTLPFVIEGATRRLTVTASGLEGQSVRGVPIRIAWSDVKRVRFSRFSGYLTFESAHGWRVRANAFMHGAEQLPALVRQHLRADGLTEALAGFIETQRAYLRS